MMSATLLSLMGLTSALISGVTGLAGGVLLLSLLLVLFPLEVAIPLHALVQVLANLSRVLVMRAHIDWELWRAFNLLTIPAGLLGAYSVSYLPKALIQGSVGAVILLAAVYTLRPKRAEDTSGPPPPSRARYITLGAISSGLGMVVGATGPLIAPFFLIAGLKRERFIATKSGCQLTVQVIKTVIFAKLLSFSYLSYSQELGLIVIGVLAGTYLAKRLLAKVSGAWLEVVIALMLIALGGKMIYSAVVA